MGHALVSSIASVHRQASLLSRHVWHCNLVEKFLNPYAAWTCCSLGVNM